MPVEPWQTLITVQKLRLDYEQSVAPIRQTLEGLTELRQLTREINASRGVHKTSGTTLASKPDTPSEVSAEQRLDEYVPATAVFRLQGRYPTYKQFKRWLDSVPYNVIRRKKPRRNRLEIHAGDFIKHWQSVHQEAFALLDEVAERAEAVRKAKGRKLSRPVFAQAEAEDSV